MVFIYPPSRQAPSVCARAWLLANRRRVREDQELVKLTGFLLGRITSVNGVEITLREKELARSDPARFESHSGFRTTSKRWADVLV